MANISVRNLDDRVRDELRAQAQLHGHSMEEEIRQILEEAASHRRREANPFIRLMRQADASGGVDLELPPRDFTEGLDFSGDDFA